MKKLDKLIESRENLSYEVTSLRNREGVVEYTARISVWHSSRIYSIDSLWAKDENRNIAVGKVVGMYMEKYGEN